MTAAALPRAAEQSTVVTVGRQRLRVAVRPGAAGVPPLLMCNGIGAPHEALKPFADALDPRIPVVRFDVPGVGGSAPWRFPVPYQVIARTAGRLVRELGHDRFDVLGISWGGALAQQIAFQNPRRARRLVLAATGPGCVMLPARPGVLRHLVTPARYRDAEYRCAVAGELYGGAVRRDPALARALLGGADRPPSQTGYLHQLLAGLGWSSLPWLPLIRQRTLLLAGTDDPIIPLVNARVMARLLPDCQLHVYDDGHLALLTAVDELAPVVSSFLLET